jgi:hypothetical protein
MSNVNLSIPTYCFALETLQSESLAANVLQETQVTQGFVIQIAIAVVSLPSVFGQLDFRSKPFLNIRRAGQKIEHMANGRGGRVMGRENKRSMSAISTFQPLYFSSYVNCAKTSASERRSSSAASSMPRTEHWCLVNVFRGCTILTKNADDVSSMTYLLHDLRIATLECFFLLFEDFEICCIHTVDDIPQFVQASAPGHVDHLPPEPSR